MIETATALGPMKALIARAPARRCLLSVTVEVDIADPCATVFASRLADDRWFCWEQPDRDGFALACLGSAHEAVSRGPDRFDDVAAEAARIMRGRLADEAEALPAGAGPVWTGGFAFAPDGARAAQWASLPPALLVLPELSLLRAGGRTWLTLNAVGGGVSEDAITARAERRLSSLTERPLPLVDPSPGADP
jgi:hypothetical protein